MATEAIGTGAAQASERAAAEPIDGTGKRLSLVNPLTAVAFVLGLMAGCMWLAMFLGAPFQVTAAGVAVGMAGVVVGTIGLLQARQDEEQDSVTAAIGLTCAILGLIAAIIMTATMVTVTQGLQETNEILKKTTEMSVPETLPVYTEES